VQVVTHIHAEVSRVTLVSLLLFRSLHGLDLFRSVSLGFLLVQVFMYRFYRSEIWAGLPLFSRMRVCFRVFSFIRYVQSASRPVVVADQYRECFHLSFLESRSVCLPTGFPALCLGQVAQYNSKIMMAMIFPRLRSHAMHLIISLILLTVGCVLVGSPPHAAANSLIKGQELSRQADALIREGHEQQAAQLYLAAHMQFQDVILKYFESALRESLGGPTAERDEEALVRAGSLVGDLRNVNLSKLWIILDPEDRTYRQGLEAERAALLQQFDHFIRADSAGPLDAFLSRLYPEDESGEHQMEAVREGQMPRSKRWERLQRPFSP
jgi:hypothetical protein